MEKQKAINIINTYKLIPGQISRAILRLIINNKSIDQEVCKDFISQEQFNHLKNLYFLKKNELGQKLKKTPKYLPFYLIANEKFPNFKWEVKTDSVEKPLVTFKSLKVKNLRPSLLSLLLDKVNEEECSLLCKDYDSISVLPKIAIKALSDFMEKTEALYPNENEMQLIVDWLSTCLNKNESTIFIPICPDYSAEPCEDKRYLFKHNFKALNAGIGLIAQRILGILPALMDLLGTLKIQPKIICGIADFEGFSKENLQRFSITEEEFLRRVNLSRLAFMEKANMSTHMITDLFGGKVKWLECVKLLKAHVDKGQYGQADISPVILRGMVKKRMALYSRWYGEKSSLDEYIPIVLQQGLDYAAMGFFIAAHLKNCLVLGADNPVMSPFYNFKKPIATLYFKRYYC